MSTGESGDEDVQQHSPGKADHGEPSSDEDDEGQRSHGDAATPGIAAAIAFAPLRYPLVFNVLALAMQNCPGLCQARRSSLVGEAEAGLQPTEAKSGGEDWMEAHAVELTTLALASAFTLLTWPGLVWVEGRCLRSFAPILLMLLSVSGLALGWYNAWQDDHFLESCYLSDRKQACLNPRYRWYDVVYDYAFREKCMMARMSDHTSFDVKERQCYVMFQDRGPQCLKFAGQCLLAAAVIGYFAINDSPIGVVQSPPTEAGLLAQAQVQENMREGEMYLADYRAAALCDN